MNLFTVIAFGVMFAFEAFSGSIDIIAKTLYHEARGEGEIGLRAVASVIHNRSLVNNGKVTSDFCASEALKKNQFSCWNGKSLRSGTGKAWNVCVKIAKEIDSGTFKTTHKYTHYYAFKLCSPKWAKGKKGKIIGNHKFLNA